jgi:thiazole tautomerase (transcriptional regulator TenI)
LAPDAVPVVHAVTDDEVLARPDALERMRAVMRALGPRGALHLRGPHTPASRQFDLAVPLAAEQVRGGAWLVVNDRVDLALAAGARAAQLTSRSLTVRQARALSPAGTLRLGASVHGVAEATFAAADGADGLVAGNVFETRTHPGAPGRGIGLVREVLAAATVPVIAIGGVLPEHVRMLRAAGVAGVAAISGIWGADDAAAAAARYLSAHDDAPRTGLA